MNIVQLLEENEQVLYECEPNKERMELIEKNNKKIKRVLFIPFWLCVIATIITFTWWITVPLLFIF